MNDFIAKFIDGIAGKVGSLLNLTLCFIISTELTLKKRIDEDSDYKPSLLLFSFYSVLAYYVMSLAFPKEVDTDSAALGFMISQLIMAILYSVAAHFALKSVRLSSNLSIVIKSTFYLYGQATFCAALCSSVIMYSFLHLNSNLVIGIAFSVSLGIFWLMRSWWIMSKLFHATKFKAMISFVLVVLYTLPVVWFLSDINKVLINIAKA